MPRYERKCIDHPGGRHERHGGGAAIAALTEGTPFKGIAAVVEQSIRTELEESGRAEFLLTRVIRAATVQDIYYGLIRRAIEDGDLVALDRYTKPYAWLTNTVFRAIGQLREEQKENPNLVIEAAVRAAKEATGEHSESD